jgi:hypothetical protein
MLTDVIFQSDDYMLPEHNILAKIEEELKYVTGSLVIAKAWIDRHLIL